VPEDKDKHLDNAEASQLFEVLGEYRIFYSKVKHT
jgi:hypothetical protein